MKIENKEFTATTLVEKLTNPTKLKTVSELFAEQIERYKTAKRTGYALSIQQVYNSILKYKTQRQQTPPSAARDDVGYGVQDMAK